MPKPASKYNMMILVSWKIEPTSSELKHWKVSLGDTTAAAEL